MAYDIEVPDFKIVSRVYQSINSLVYRAINTSNGQYVILKTTFSDHPSLEELAALQHEYDILNGLNIKGVLHTYGIIKKNQQLVLILEDIQGESLQQFLAGHSVSLDVFLKISLALVDILAGLKKAHVIHKDIKTSSIIIQPETLDVKLIDFSIATTLDQEEQAEVSPNTLEGTLAYMSPEQTGRMNRSIDYRSDLYSLGAVMFEMLTGELIFTANDPLEWVHAHLAKVPPLVTTLNPEVPKQVAAIIAKLLAKTPEERYNSAEALKIDLLRCQKEWKENKTISEFPLNQYQLNDQLRISQKLYGREAQIRELLAIFKEVAQGQSLLTLVAGPSGIGKTSLIKEIYKPVLQQQAYFISGKFDQLQKYIPYSALIKAFQELVKQLLTESDYKLKTIREQLQKALDGNGQVIIDVVPEVEMIIGKQSKLPELNATATQNRLIHTFQQFVKVFAQSTHPLVLFLDDLQWADSASLRFIEGLLEDPDMNYLLVLGAYRSDEVDNTHPLMMLITSLEKRPIKPSKLTLSTLSISDVSSLLADSFNLSKEKVETLAAVVHAKTYGNPFFINEFLKTLYTQGLLYFSYTAKTWEWKIDEINALPATLNVIDLLVDDIKKLSPDTQHILKLAASIGFRFDLYTLATINKQTPMDAINLLWQAIVSNLVRPLDKNYKSLFVDNMFFKDKDVTELAKKSVYSFVHDRVYQAANELMSPEDKEVIHLQIARLLTKNQTVIENEDRLFEVVSHFNLALPLITDEKEKEFVINLNLQAGRRAKASNAYELAVEYLSSGKKLLNHHYWQKNYKLAYELYLALAENEYLAGHLDEADHYFRLLQKRAKTKLDKAKIYRIKIEFHSLRGEWEKGAKLAIEALRLFKINLTLNPSVFRILREVIHTRLLIGFNRLDKMVANMKPMTNPTYLMVDNLFSTVIGAGYFYNKKLLGLAFFKAISFDLKHGYSKYTSSAFAGCAFILITRFNAFKLGFKLLDIGLHYEEMFADNTAIARSHIGLGIFLAHWEAHSLQSVEYLKVAYQAGLDAGDINFMVYARSSIPYILFYSRSLEQVYKEIEIAIPLLKKLDTDAPLDSGLILKYIVQTLRNEPTDIDKNEVEELFEKIKISNNGNYEALAATFLSRFYLVMGDIPASLKYIEKAFTLSESHEGAFNFTQGYIIYALCLTSLYPTFSPFKRFRVWLKLKAFRKRLAKWSKQSDINFIHNYLLVSAEMARLQGKYLEAERLYNEAIESAEKNDYILYVALANEYAFKYFLSRQNKRYAKLHLLEAYYNYKRWGALAKCKLLEQIGEREQLNILDSSAVKHLETSITTAMAYPMTLDYLAVMKSMQVLSGEIQVDKLLQKLVHIVLEHAGAHRCVILVRQGDKWLVEAEGDLNSEKINLDHAELLEKRNDLPLSIIHYTQRTLKPYVVQDAGAIKEFANDAYLNSGIPKSILVLPILYQAQLRRIIYLENQSATHTFTSQHIQSVQILASQAVISLENAKFYTASNRFVPYAFLQRLNRNNLIDVQIGDQVERTMSILFCDIQGFTHLSETKTAEEIFHLVSEFLGGMEPIITRYRGFIDKYIGDAIMALFDNADDAVQAAIAMYHYQNRFNEACIKEGRYPISIGIGLNTGKLILGMVGNAKRMDGSVIGDSVNVAARVESLTRQYKVPLLITDDTRLHLKNPGNYQLRLIHSVSVKGKEKPFDVWEVVLPAPKLS